MAKGELDLAAKLFRQFRDHPVNLYYETEDVLISLGYRLLQANKPDRAVGILNLSVRDKPPFSRFL